MPYSDFDLKTVQDRFGLTVTVDVDLFGGVAEVPPRPWLQQMLEEWAPVAVGINTEKARSEMIIAPVLMEAVAPKNQHVRLLSGVTFDVDKERGLSGTCDFLLTLSQQIYFVSRPVLAVVEAKKEDISAGLGQCAAEMVAAQLFNAEKPDGLKGPFFGAVTTGSLWRFLKLEGAALQIDRPEYFLHPVGKILGILTTILTRDDA